MKIERKKQLARMVYKAMTNPKYANEEGLQAVNAAAEIVSIQIRKFNLKVK